MFSSFSTSDDVCTHSSRNILNERPNEPVATCNNSQRWLSIIMKMAPKPKNRSVCLSRPISYFLLSILSIISRVIRAGRPLWTTGPDQFDRALFYFFFFQIISMTQTTPQNWARAQLLIYPPRLTKERVVPLLTA